MTGLTSVDQMPQRVLRERLIDLEVVRPAGNYSSGMSCSISSSQACADMSDGARQSPRGDSAPPWDTLGPLGSAERLNWLNE